MVGSSSRATTQDKGKGHIVAPPSPPTSRILNQVNDEIIDDPHLQVNNTRIVIPFTIAWYQHLEPTKGAIWGSLGIQELLRLSHFSLTTHPWMIGAVTCFWNRTTNNFHLPCRMIGMSLLDMAAITGLPINSPDCTPDMQSQHQYNVTFSTSYSEFIAHNMGTDGTEIIDNEHVAFLFYWLNAVLFCSQSVQMPKLFLSLAALLHEGKVLNLAKLLLGHIFEELGLLVCDLRDNKIINTGGDTNRVTTISERKVQDSPLVLPSSSESADESEPTNKDTLAASSQSEDATDSDPGSHEDLEFLRNIVVPDSDSASKAADTTNSNSSRSKVSENPLELQPNPPFQANPQTPTGPKPKISNAPTTPTSATLDDLIVVLNKVIQENKLLDHPPTTWVNDPILNKLLADLLNSSFELPTNTAYSASIQEFKQLLNNSVASQFQLQETENKEVTARSNIEDCFATAQPIQTSREEFDRGISHAISDQAFHD
ncbi:hypothetical protein Ahy_B10g100956 [Arachis hypogaea]|uniref:Aminotransferase-like plant mobile domain-containing protein n=1 Tax=Arachis hypogaea TaxID=3818 RepID=A0A444WYE1_ARAHY|nr:hypothetical protein Ahy_B10g100956 [Arachis hypogaea]